jgi:UTP--glucose-1-phosphate uridylyltransferase
MSCLSLTLRTGTKVQKAVIPAAGFGQRLFPASKATIRELFPIIDRDGIAKPAILYIVEEAIDAGIEEIIIIVQEHDLIEFESFFNVQIPIENYNKLSPNFQEYSQHILDIGRRVKFVIQERQEGFGHAVYQTRDIVGNEPFLLMLGDHLYRSNNSQNCARQLLDAYNQHGISILGLRQTSESEIAGFGTVSGFWIEESKLLNVTSFIEKPTVDFARNNLRIPGLPDGEYLTVFGQYIIKSQIFDYLEENINNNVREHGEFQLTSALDRLRKEEGFMGLIINGQRYDIGLPEHYLETLARFHLGKNET